MIVLPSRWAVTALLPRFLCFSILDLASNRINLGLEHKWISQSISQFVFPLRVIAGPCLYRRVIYTPTLDQKAPDLTRDATVDISEVGSMHLRKGNIQQRVTLQVVFVEELSHERQGRTGRCIVFV